MKKLLLLSSLFLLPSLSFALSGFDDQGSSGGGGGGLNNIVEDTTPELGGDLDASNYNIDIGSITDSNGTVLSSLLATYYYQIDFYAVYSGTDSWFYTASSSVPSYGKLKFDGSASTVSNRGCAMYTAPRRFDADIDMRVETFAIMLSSADTGSHRYYVDISTYANSKGITLTDGSDEIAVSIPADASGAQYDSEAITSAVTLTGWKDLIDAGAPFQVCVSRAGDDGTNDTSTVPSSLQSFVIRMGVTSP